MTALLHPSFRRLKAYADGLAPSRRRERLAEHLEACGRCRDIVREVGEIRARLATWREPVPETAWPAIVARLDRVAGPTVDRGSAAGRVGLRPASGAWPRALARAAVLVLAAAGLLSAAVPGSPVRSWIEALVARGLADAPAPMPTAPPPGVEIEAPPPVAGVVLPARRPVSIVVLQAPPELRVRVTTVAGGDAVVRATGAAASAIFRPRGDGVEVVAPGAGSLEIELPVTGARITLDMNGQRYLVSEGGEIRLFVPAVDTVGGLTFTVGR
jgi:hypothetical protein